MESDPVEAAGRNCTLSGYALVEVSWLLGLDDHLNFFIAAIAVPLQPEGELLECFGTRGVRFKIELHGSDGRTALVGLAKVHASMAAADNSGSGDFHFSGQKKRGGIIGSKG